MKQNTSQLEPSKFNLGFVLNSKRACYIKKLKKIKKREKKEESVECTKTNRFD